MKNRLKYIFWALAAVTIFVSCEKQNMAENIRIQHPEKQAPVLRDAAYFERLRAYKQTPHKLAFGWYGSWTAIGASEQSRLRSAPDSMDIISLWSQWHSLNARQIADKEQVQKRNGTKIVICVLAKFFPDQFKEPGGIRDGVTDAAIIAYARAFAKDSMEKYNYDGIDIDFETASDHRGPLTDIPGAFKTFCTEMSKYIGPKSNTGRMFIIDGNIDSIDPSIPELCTYAVSQAYNCRSSSDLNNRTASAGRVGWKPEQIMFTENFESLWKNGGVTYTLPNDGGTLPSLLGMAHYAKTGVASGFGSYHMEYEYGHADMPYKFMRMAIQLANPAPIGDYSKILISINEAGELKFNQTTEFSTNVTGRISLIPTANTDISLRVDNSLIAAYNDYNFTSHKAVDPSLVSFSGPFHFTANKQQTETPVSISIPTFSTLEAGTYLVPIRVDFGKMAAYAPDTNKEILYLFITKTDLPK